MEKNHLVSIVIAAYNEEALLEKNLNTIFNFMKSIENRFDWEVILVNDGSKDNTGKIADEIAEKNKKFRVLHHKMNKYLGCALRTGFSECKGDFIITLDLDLSYSTDHIEKLLSKITETGADVVLASPYMKGGKVSNVPFSRKLFSRVLNFLLQIISREDIHTFTGMVRVYKADFLKSLNLKARDFEINTEIIYKSILLRAIILEIPAHLSWDIQKTVGKSRISSLRLVRGILSGFMSGFIFRPYIFFILVGTILLILSSYMLIWIFYHVYLVYPAVHSTSTYFDDRFSNAVAEVFRLRPHTFTIAGISLVVALQFLSMGFLSVQNKRYFEETFHLNTTIYKLLNEKKENK